MQIKASKVHIPASSDASVSATLANSTGLALVPTPLGTGSGGSGGTIGPFTQTYYVSPLGNDNNIGTSPAAPWRTVSRAVQANWTAGEGLLFERGGTYQVNAISKAITAVGAARFTIGSYGTGAAPILAHWKICNNSASWVLHSAGIWKIQLSNPATHTGMTEVPQRVAFGNESSTNIGFVSVDGTIFGAKKTSIAACVNQWDFFGDTTGDWFYMRSSANPKSLCSDLRLAPDGRLIQMQSNLEVVDLEFQGCGGVAFSGAGSNPTNTKILRNVIRDVGGSFLIGFGNPPYTTRWGDAIEIFANASNCEVAYNTVIGSFDPAIIVAQGGGTISNIHVHHNDISFSCCAFELSIKNGSWSNITVEDNTSTDIGLSQWPSLYQPNQDRNSGMILMHLTPTYGSATNIVFRRNYFERCSRYIFAGDADAPHAGTWATYDPPNPIGCTFTDNTIKLASGREIQFTRETINNSATYKSRTGREVGSTFTVL